MAYQRVIREGSAWRLLAGTCVLLAALASTGALQAAEAAKDPKQDAKAHFRAGQNHYNLNEFREALIEFKEAYRLFPDPVFLYNLGQCERQLGHPEDAIRFYRNFLREQPKASNRQEVLHRIDEMEAELKAKPEGAAATAPVAPVPGAAPPPVVVPPAPVTAPPPAVAPAPGTTVTPALPATPPVNAAATPERIDLAATPAPEADNGPAPIYKRWWFWTAAAAVAVGAGVGIYAATSGGGNGAPATDLGSKRVF